MGASVRVRGEGGWGGSGVVARALVASALVLQISHISTLMIWSRSGLSSATSSSTFLMRTAGDVCAHSPRPMAHDLVAASRALSESSSEKRAWWPIRIFSSEFGCAH